MKKTITLLFFSAGIYCLPIYADGPSLMENGSFEFSDVPAKWIIFSAEPSPTEWVKIVESPEDGGRMIELMAGPPERYVAQDIKIEEGQSGLYQLRWKSKGEGTAGVGLLARDADGNFLEPSSKQFPVTQDFEDHEISLIVPEEAVYVRVTIAAESPGSVVVFDEMEFVLISDPE
jgi:hypothetical protein